MINRMNAIATISYLQRAVAIVPTTGAEWSQVAQVVSALEGVANGMLNVAIAPAGATEPPKAADNPAE